MNTTLSSRLAPVAALILLAGTAAYVVSSPAGPEPTASARAAASQQGQGGSGDGPPAGPSRGVSGGPANAQVPDQTAPQTTEQIATARRGSIAETLTLNARITTGEETALSFQAPQRIGSVLVSAGDKIVAGQVLVQADERELARSLGAARERLATASERLRKAEQNLEAQQRLTERRLAASGVRAKRSVADAESVLRQAEIDLERVQAGATPAERRAAETAVASARAAYARAEADLNKTREGADDIEYRTAQQQVISAQLAMQKAEDDVQKLQRGADPSALATADRDVMNAQNALTRAQLDLQKLMEPDQTALLAADREVQRAESAFRVAQLNASAPISTGGTGSAVNARVLRAERQAALDNARWTLQAAQERLQQVRSGPPPGEVSIAQRNYAAARSALESAQERAALARQGPDAFALTQAQLALEGARLTYEAAVGRLYKLAAGPAGDQVTSAIANFQSAETSLRAAEQQQVEMLARPTRTELERAEAAVARAKDALGQALAEADVAVVEPTTEPLGPGSSPATDPAILRQVVEQEQAAVDALERDIMNARLVAPFDGVVIALGARAREGIDAGRPAVTVAPVSGQPLVRADLPAAEAARLTVGQAAQVQYGGTTGGTVEAPLAEMDTTLDGQVRLTLRPAWGPNVPTLGSPVNLGIELARRTDVVLVPVDALRGSGTRRLIEVVEGAARRTAEVDIGLVAGGDAEIVSGLEPGTRVVLTR